MRLLDTGVSLTGASQKNRLGEYLAILSVLQTCEYRGLNVLDFLLSGETNLDRSVNHRQPAHQASTILAQAPPE
jgi:hypothetical protein